MRHATQITSLLTVALMLTGIGAAQTPRPAPATPQTPAPTSTADNRPPSDAQQSGASSQDQPHTAPVFWISSVEVMRSLHAPQLDVIRVRGLASNEGWESAELIPLTKGVPADGILDLMLVAEAPADNTTSTPYLTMEAVFTIEPGHPFQGVRVHGAANRVTVKTFPGYAEAAIRPVDCSSCIGKYFVPRGAAAPSTRAKESLVREEELPHNLRVLRDSEGVGSLYSDPNRMTLLLNAEGQIVMTMWD